MNNTLEKELNEYREDLQELTNSDLLIEYKYSCIEVERLRKLFRNNSDNKNLQNSLDYERQIEMRFLELKTLQIKDDIPLYVTLDSLTTYVVNENRDLKRYKFVTRNADSCVYTPVYMLKLYPSSSKEKIVTLLEYFFKVCDVGASPQCVWKTDDCDYISLLLPYTRYDQIKFDLVRKKILEQFPELLMPENCLEKLPDYGKTEDYIASIEVAYPATWTVEYEMIDSCK